MSKTPHDEERLFQEDDFEQQRPEWGHKQFKRMVWKTRWKFFLNAGGALFLVFLVYHIYVSALHIYFDQSEVRNNFLRSIISVVEMHGDGLRVEKRISAQPFEVTPFLTQKANLKIYRHVGSWEVITGEIQAKLSITGKFTYSITNTGAYLNGNNPGPFYLPYSLVDGKPDHNDSEENSSLKRLVEIDDGHVAEMSLSLKNLASPDQLMKLLSDYDVAVTAMPIYSGESTQPGASYSLAGMFDYNIPHLTLKPLYEFNENGARWFNYFVPEDTGQMQEQIDAMMTELKWMINHLDYNEATQDKQRLAYLEKTGVQVYGAVVTGPVRELEKLTKLAEFHHFQLSRVEVWNWD
ncbi:anti sigma factor C-terminal domain-containing protein [Paenibacillus sp. ACRRY]|uniref:anti sigma factor C-terminal domain-containing protein n=1 Tax=Paenibacillus sp. ACRRY TaxID=2918208 RepID=UPI001EF4283B|nr:anti sigma factor C-terminal domain-containing protein [Paenibacillus sp. ACRRY]MCG7382164.1 anti-sigma factor C-terminal domain-containing protein [Paenibacillus sp. ACRRY]